MAAFNDRKDSRRLALAWLMLTFYWSLHREWHVRVIILNSFAVLRPPFVPKTESKKQKLVRKFLTNGFLEINVRKKERMYGLFYKMSKLRNLFNLSLYYDSKRFYFFSPFFCFPVLWKTEVCLRLWIFTRPIYFSHRENNLSSSWNEAIYVTLTLWNFLRVPMTGNEMGLFSSRADIIDPPLSTLSITG